MKAIGTSSAFERMPKIYRDAAQAYAAKHLQELQGDIIERVVLALALTLSDLYGFGQTRIERTITAFQQILEGYGDECYTPRECRQGGDIGRMAETMKAELERRGINIEFQ